MDFDSFELHKKTEPTYRVEIFVAGDVAEARRVCREYCMKFGLCVTVEPTAYIYTGGEEIGVRVGLINYPRFPASPEKIKEHAVLLGYALREMLFQWSFTIVTPDETTWYSVRPEGN